MKYLLSLLLLFCSLVANINASNTNSAKPATIKVLLEKKSSGVLIESRGPFVVYNPENGKKISSGQRDKRFFCHPHNEGIKWGENFLGIFQIHIEPSSPNTTFLINGKQYFGAIHLYHVEDKLNVINEIDIESYVKTTLSNKNLASQQPKVLDSIAIIARTDAYYSAIKNTHAFWHVNAKDTGYTGMGLSLQNIEIDKAVDNTRYLVMVYNKKPFPSSWTKHCGGKTASYSSIFRKNIETPNGITSPFATNNRMDSQWNFTINTQDLAKIVKTNRVTGIDLFVDRSSGKIYATRIHDGSHSEDISFIDLQKALGENQIKSNDFTVNIKGNIAIFEGFGEGVSSGLCIFSAEQMSDRGDEVPYILETFYPESELKKIREFPNKIASKENQKNKKKKYKLLHR